MEKANPFGENVASEIFQKRLHQALEGLGGVLTVHDDMIICGTGDTIEEATTGHSRKFEKFLNRCGEKAIKLNRKKLQLLTMEVTYMGHLVTNKGLQADPAKTKAIVNMPKPENVKAVRQFCGFVNVVIEYL